MILGQRGLDSYSMFCDWESPRFSLRERQKKQNIRHLLIYPYPKYFALHSADIRSEDMLGDIFTLSWSQYKASKEKIELRYLEFFAQPYCPDFL